MKKKKKRANKKLALNEKLQLIITLINFITAIITAVKEIR